MIPGPDLHALRSEQLTGAVKAFGRLLMLVDKHPSGAGGESRSDLAPSGRLAVMP